MALSIAIIKQSDWPKQSCIPAYYDHAALYMFISEDYRKSMSRDWQTHFWVIWSLGWYKYMSYYGLKEATAGGSFGMRQADRFAFAYTFYYLKKECNLLSIDIIKDPWLKELLKTVKIINQYFHNASFILKYYPQK
jgi:hypothetical protein